MFQFRNVLRFSCAIFVTGTIAGCSNTKTDEVSSTTLLSSSLYSELSQALGTVSMSSLGQQKMMKSGSVHSLSTPLTDSQIQSIVDAAKAAVESANLTSSSDLIALLPVIAAGAEDKLDQIDVTSAADKIALIEVISESLLTSMSGREANLPAASADAGLTPAETALNKLSTAVISHFGDAGLASTDISTASEAAMNTMVENLGSAGIPLSGLEGAVKQMTAGAVNGLDNISVSGFSASNLPTMVASLTAGATKGLGSISATGYDSSKLPDMVKNVAAGATGALGNISMTGYDKNNLGAMVKQISGGIVGALDGISMTGYQASSLPSMIESASSGVVANLGSITLSGYAATDVSDLASAATAGATGALDKIVMTGYNSDSIATMAGKITTGATKGMGSISMTGFDVTNLPAVAKSITSGATGELGNIVMSGYDATKLPAMVEQISAGATGALGEISMTGYSASNLNDMVKQISAGSTAALGTITMTGYDATSLPKMMEGITSGATGALGSISMTGYSVSNVGDMAKNISAGATASLGSISMIGYDATDVTEMIKYASSGATQALGNITMLGYDSSKIQSMVQSISQGCTDSISSITGLGTINATTAIQSLAEGVSLGAQGISTTYPTVINTTDLQSWIQTGASTTANGYTIPNLTTSVSTGYNAEPTASFLSFLDTNSSAGIIAGNITIGASMNETSVAYYRVYFGTNSTTKTGAAITSQAKSAGANLNYTLTNTAVPTGATHLLVYVVKLDATESSIPMSISLMDLSSTGATLSGATNSMLNTVYAPVALINGKQAYMANGYFIFWESGYWILHSSYTLTMPGMETMTTASKLQMAQLYVASTASTPPSAGWLVGYSGASSAATVSAN